MTYPEPPTEPDPERDDTERPDDQETPEDYGDDLRNLDGAEKMRRLAAFLEKRGIG